MPRMDFTIRTLRRDEMPLGHRMAAHEGWNPGFTMPTVSMQPTPRASLSPSTRARPMGCISAVSYAGRFGFIGLYIVAPAWRGRGVGISLWKAGHGTGSPASGRPRRRARAAGQLPPQRLRTGVEQRPLRRHRTAAGPPCRPRSSARPRSTSPRSAPTTSACFPRPAKPSCAAGSRCPTQQASLACDAGSPCGLGTDPHDAATATRSAPLSPTTFAIANALYAALSASVPAGDAVYLDVPLPNADAVALAKTQDMQQRLRNRTHVRSAPAPACELNPPLRHHHLRTRLKNRSQKESPASGAFHSRGAADPAPPVCRHRPRQGVGEPHEVRASLGASLSAPGSCSGSPSCAAAGSPDG